MSEQSSAIELTRRAFLVAAGATASAAALGTLVGCGGGSGGSGDVGIVDQSKAYRFSTRDVGTASNAAKLHAGSMRFVSPQAAEACRAHPGDKSRIVSIDIKPATWQQWFGSGTTKADLRKI